MIAYLLGVWRLIHMVGGIVGFILGLYFLMLTYGGWAAVIFLVLIAWLPLLDRGKKNG